MTTFIEKTIGLVAVCGMACGAGAQTVWTGVVSGDWLDARNWSPAGVPGQDGQVNADVVIDPANPTTVRVLRAPSLLQLNSLRVPDPAVVLLIDDTDGEIAGPYENAGTMMMRAAGGRSRMSLRSATVTGREIILESTPGQPGSAQLKLWAAPTLPATMNLHGSGSLVGAVTNMGRIVADRGGEELSCDMFAEQYDLTNRGTIGAAGGGVLSMGIFVADNAGGTFMADGGTINLRGAADIHGGTIATRNGGRVYLRESIYLYGVQLDGEITLTDRGSLRLNPDGRNPVVRNTGTLTAVKETAGVNPATISVRGPLTLTGSGTIVLAGRPGQWSEAQLVDNGFPGALTNAAGHTIEGCGLINTAVVNQGRIRVGRAQEIPGGASWTAVEFAKMLTPAPTGVIEIPIASGGAGGHLIAREPLVLAGGLAVPARTVGFHPSAGEEWSLVSAPAISGAFSAVTLPPVPAGLRWRLEVLDAGGTQVLRLRADCVADFNGDDFVDFFDYDDYVRCFEGGCDAGRTADYNGDGFVDFFDYDDFVQGFEAGC